MSDIDDYLALIRSDRVSAATRDALLTRLEPDDPDYAPTAIDAAAFATLRALLSRSLPQDRVDLAQRVDKALAEGATDGWRFAALLPDPAAFRAMLAELDGFAALDSAAQDATLQAIADGDRGEQVKLFFEDLRGQATMLYVSHPSTLARIGYAGIAYGSGPCPPGFVALAAGEREAWEPEASAP